MTLPFYGFPGTNFQDLNLDWMLQQVKNCLAEWAATKTEWETLSANNEAFKTQIEAEWDELRQFVTDYFNNLDVSQEISDKINAMAADGSLLLVIQATVQTSSATAAAAWLAVNITQETGYVLDTTLTVAGAAADAKATGTRISNVETATIKTLEEITILNISPTTTRTCIALNGSITSIDNNAWATSSLVDITDYDYLLISAGSGYNKLVYAFYDENEGFISGLNSGSSTMSISQQETAITGSV